MKRRAKDSLSKHSMWLAPSSEANIRKEPKEQRDCSTCLCSTLLCSVLCPHLLMMMKQHCRISVNFLEIVFCLLATDSGERELLRHPVCLRLAVCVCVCGIVRGSVTQATVLNGCNMSSGCLLPPPSPLSLPCWEICQP